MTVELYSIQKIAEEAYAGSDVTFRYEFVDNDGDAKDLNGYTPKLYIHKRNGDFIVSQTFDATDSTLTTGIVEVDTTIPSTGYAVGTIVTLINGSDFSTFATMSVRQLDIAKHSFETS